MSAKWKHLTWKRIARIALIVVCGVIPCWVFIGGIDCAPPDDADLIIPLCDKPFERDGNGWVMLTNVLAQVDAGEMPFWNQLVLDWYAHPEWNHDFDDPDVLAYFTNTVTGSAYVETSLKSNEVLLAAIDAAIAAPTYAPPLTPHESMINGGPCLPLSTLFDVNRGVLPARVKCAIEKGDFDAAAEYYKKNLRLATLLQTRCGSFVEYLVGVAMLEEDVSLLERELDDSAIPAEKLRVFDNLLKDLPGLSPGAFAHALKWEYFYAKEGLRFKPVEVVFPGKSVFAKLLLTPIARYACHPNRCLCVMAECIRNAIQYDVVPCEEGICWRRKLGWIGVLIPNCYENVGLSGYRAHRESVKRLSEEVASVRRKIAERIASSQTNGTITATSQYFPLVFTNGCYYTHDMKRIIGVGTGSVVVGGDVDISNEVSFEDVKAVVIPAGCTNCLDAWRDAFVGPCNLQEIVVAQDHPEIGVSGGVVYDRRTKRALNFVGKEIMIAVPKGIIVDDTDLFLRHLPLHGAEWLHFKGPLPEFCKGEGSAKDTLARRIKRWWRYKEWDVFKHIFKKQVWPGALHLTTSNLVVTVSRENADERTKSIVESGVWEGRRILWFDEMAEELLREAELQYARSIELIKEVDELEKECDKYTNSEEFLKLEVRKEKVMARIRSQAQVENCPDVGSNCFENATGECIEKQCQ